MEYFSYLVLVATIIPNFVKARPSKSKSSQVEDSSKQVNGADSFWPISSHLHGNGSHPSRLYATLHYATMTSEEASLEGHPRSYIDIANDGRLDGQTSFTWIFNITPVISQESVILEYYGNGNGPGVQFQQVNDSLKVTIFDALGSFVGEAVAATVLSIGNWNFVGFNYIPERGDVNIIKDTTSTAYHVTDTSHEANAFGDVRIGASSDGSLPFLGTINCVQFYELALVDKALLKPMTFCDPDLWNPDVLDWTQSYLPPSTTAPSTTTSTTTTLYTTTTTTTTTTAATATMEPNIVLSDYWRKPIKEECINYKTVENQAFDSSSVFIFTTSSSSLVQCVGYCLREHNCVAFTLDAARTCSLVAQGGFVIETSADSRLYTVVRY